MSNTKEHPIVLGVDEVNALISRKKLQHRMPLEPQPFVDSKGYWAWESKGVRISVQFEGFKPFLDAMQRNAIDSKAAPYRTGDKLWAQEEHRPIGWLMGDGEVMIEYRDGYSSSYNYLTEEELETNPNDDYPLAVIDELLARKIPINEDTERFDFSDLDNLPHWRSAHVMPRFATRSVSDIVKVRIDRIQNINEAEALASGLLVQSHENGWQWFLNPLSKMESNVFHRDEWRSAFSVYWDSLHGIGSWDRNDWIWVYELKKANLYE